MQVSRYSPISLGNNRFPVREESVYFCFIVFMVPKTTTAIRLSNVSISRVVIFAYSFFGVGAAPFYLALVRWGSAFHLTKFILSESCACANMLWFNRYEKKP